MFRWVPLCKALAKDRRFRHEFLTRSRRDLRMFLKYDARIYYEKFGSVALILLLIYAVGNSRTTAKLLRLPTEDVNELLKQDVWVEERYKLNKQKEEVSKLLNDSNYIKSRNAPLSP